MPKLVDHDARRAALVDHALVLGAEGGAAALTLRGVAAAAGVSLGNVQHYFPTHDRLVAGIVHEIARRRGERVRAELGHLGRPPSGRDILQISALQGLPLDERRRRECLTELAITSAWAGHEDLVRDGVAQLLGLFEQVLTTAQEKGHLAPGADPAHEARVLWGLIASQTQLILAGAPHDAEATLDYLLGRVLP